MKTTILTRLLESSRKAWWAWAAAVVVVMSIYLPIYPSMGSAEMNEMLAALPKTLVKALNFEQVTSGAGYAQSTFFGLIGFVLLSIAAINWGAGFLVRREDDGSLELTLAHAVSRTTYYIQAATSLIVRVVLLGAVAAVYAQVLNKPAELGLSTANIVAETAALVGITLLAGTLAFAVGAITGRKMWAYLAGAALPVGAYILDAVGRLNEIEWLTAISPYSWAYGTTPLLNGPDWAGLLWLYLSITALLVTGWVVFNRRDLKL